MVEPDRIWQRPGGAGPAAVPASRELTDAGFDEVYVQQIGPDQDGFFDFFEAEIAPEFAG